MTVRLLNIVGIEAKAHPGRSGRPNDRQDGCDDAIASGARKVECLEEHSVGALVQPLERQSASWAAVRVNHVEKRTSLRNGSRWAQFER